MEMGAYIRPLAELSAKVIRKDGSVEELGVISGSGNLVKGWSWKKLVHWLRFRRKFIPLSILLLFLMLPGGIGLGAGVFFGIVTTAGVNYMASDFASGGVTPTISGFKFHASGVGITGAAIGDTAIETNPTPAPARVSGTPTNPAANQYRSVATIAYTGTNAITEWGLFSASTVGTLWDRRVFAAINVVSGDSIQFTYTLTVNSGGT